MRARVRWFNAEKGYGFLAPVGSDEEVFVRWEAVEMDGWRTLVADQLVDVVVRQTDRGPEAERVVPRDTSEAAVA